MAEPDKFEKNEKPSDVSKDTRKPSEGEELGQSEQDQIAGGNGGGPFGGRGG